MDLITRGGTTPDTTRFERLFFWACMTAAVVGAIASVVLP
jgi:hypothetical protein